MCIGPVVLQGPKALSQFVCCGVPAANAWAKAQCTSLVRAGPMLAWHADGALELSVRKPLRQRAANECKEAGADD